MVRGFEVLTLHFWLPAGGQPCLDSNGDGGVWGSLLQLLGRAERPRGLHRLLQLLGRSRERGRLWRSPRDAAADYYSTSSLGNPYQNTRFAQAFVHATGGDGGGSEGESEDEEQRVCRTFLLDSSTSC